MAVRVWSAIDDADGVQRRVAADAFRMIRQLRSMATATATVNDFKSDLGPEVADLDLNSMHPRRLIEKALLNDERREGAQ